LILNQRKQFVKGASKVRRAFKRNHDVWRKKKDKSLR
jgi:hypothetical protein